jgi:hypothetical protein
VIFQCPKKKNNNNKRRINLSLDGGEIKGEEYEE